jgi:ribosomal protein L37E
LFKTNFMEVINPPGTLLCHRCGHPNDERAFFCSNCGAPVGSKAGRYRSSGPDYRQERGSPDPGRRGYYYDGLPLISLLATILGFFAAGFIGPLIGVILGHISLRRMNKRGDDTNRGMAIASLVIGYFLLIIGILILAVLGVFIGAALFNHGWTAGNWNYL